MSTFSPESSPNLFEEEEEEEEIIPFKLLSFPSEVVLQVITCLNERDNIGVFPFGPNTDLISLSQTNKLFHSLVTPLIWESIKFEKDVIATGVRPPGYEKSRSLRTLVNNIKESRKNGRNFISIKLLCVNLRDDYESDGSSNQKEIDSLIYLLQEMKELSVVFLEELQIEINGNLILEALFKLKKLSSLRFNQVDLNWLSNMIDLPNSNNLKTLQIMHGSSQLLQLVPKFPNLESLLLWTESRKIGTTLATHIFTNLLPKLRLLSLDAVNDAATLVLLAQSLKRIHSQQIPIPLKELFIEGTQKVHERDILIESLRYTSITHLALYHIKTLLPSTLERISKSLPNLEALTLVKGDTSTAVEWEDDLEDYVRELSKFKSLTFYASDRKSLASPESIGLAQSALEYQSMRIIGASVPSLIRSVAIMKDVSEGCTAYFCNFERVGERTRLSLKKDTVKDFLIHFDRWCIVENVTNISIGNTAITNASTPSPAYFNLPSTTKISKSIFSTFDSTTTTTVPEFNSQNYLRELSPTVSKEFGDIGTYHVVKIFSANTLSKELINRIFGGEKIVGKIFRKSWDAYPLLEPIQVGVEVKTLGKELAEIKVDEGFYYINGLERIISTMETETVASFNIVGLLLKDFFGCISKKSWAEWDVEE